MLGSYTIENGFCNDKYCNTSLQYKCGSQNQYYGYDSSDQGFGYQFGGDQQQYSYNDRKYQQMYDNSSQQFLCPKSGYGQAQISKNTYGYLLTYNTQLQMSQYSQFYSFFSYSNLYTDMQTGAQQIQILHNSGWILNIMPCNSSIQNLCKNNIRGKQEYIAWVSYNGYSCDGCLFTMIKD
ncbi:hypothetical protein PPERSA_04823 [Pseudocohnilembus persalinus]|uniref:Uncharacterized protein n=1 Tax=Pseudocohnilembus persalinus TaxID=266149 RepID=A0A0V0QIZ3_PSEPJ|nr:hypothetical protein PPERSA_04823 [Pseudocohnilembus persalinus]|eukprot:KRX02201.1 hypothetical protein PPERSA_04823 [Pseudocohnilembus persalinus]